MATSITTIQLRIANTKSSIEKTQKTLDRFKNRLEKLKAKDTSGMDKNEKYWHECDIGTCEDDIKRNERKLCDLKNKLEEWRSKEDEYNAIPRIPALEEFLEHWRVQIRPIYLKEIEEYHGWENNINEKERGLQKKYPYYWRSPDKKAYEQEAKELGIDSATKGQKMRSFDPLTRRLHDHYHDQDYMLCKLDEELQKEVDFMRDDLYVRCCNAVGVITDTSDLTTDGNGHINGYVVGEEGRAEVETIVASGPIQRPHNRVLVKKCKD